jgi:hypothetical protein
MPKQALLSLAGVAIVVAVMGFVASQRPGDASGTGRGDALNAALPTPGGDLHEAAATVNGRAIPLYELEATYNMAKELAPAGTSVSRAATLDQLVLREAQRQEAVKRGFTATDAEVDAAIAASREGLDEPQSADSRAFVEAYAKSFGTSYDDYWRQPGFREIVRRTILTAKFLESVREGAPDARAAEAAVTALNEQLRASADVKILVRVD